MDFLKKLDLTPANVLKFAAIVVAALLVLAALSSFMGSSGKGFGLNSTDTGGYSKSYPGAMAPSYDVDDAAVEEMAVSQRNIAPVPGDGYTSGGDAEEFEVTDYSATIESRNAESTCGTIKGLKERSEVVFEHASEGDDSCSYTFKVENDSVSSILSVIEDLEPRELTESTRTIKQVIEDHTSELDILNSKLAAIDSTLADAIAAYDDITAVARNSRDAESLAKIIDSKIQIIERLTQRRIEVASQIERIERSKTIQLDRLNYTYFYVNVYENKFIDGEALIDSWKRAVRNFVAELNATIQGVTIGFIGLLFVVLQYALYFFLLLFVAKYGWKATKDIWNK